MTRNVLLAGLLTTAIVYQLPQSATAQVSPEQIATVRNVTSSVVSEDGQFVAYTVSVPADPKKENLGNKTLLYVLNTVTGVSKPFYTANSISQISIRPKKGTITFLARPTQDKVNSVYEISLNGGEAAKVYSNTSNNIVSYTWHPDGNQLAIITSESGVLPKTSLVYTPDFFEESYRLRPLYVVNTTSDDVKKINVSGSVYLTAWSPNGDDIALSVAPSASVDDSYMKQSIKIVNVASNSIISSIDNKGKLSQMTWSPDGKQLALVAAFDLNDPTDGSLHVVSKQGGKPRVIDGDYLGKYESISWTEPNAINFLSSEGTSCALGSIQIGNGVKNYTYRSDAHHITSFSKNKSGVLSFTASTPTHPSELFTIAKKGTPIKRTDNNTWLKNLELGKQEVVTYKSRDGKFSLQGLLIYPLGYQAGTTVPLITVVHGGPESHYSNGWITGYSNPGQMAAAKGYAVFYPNYRGSTGRGIAFTYSSQGDLAGKEFDDIVDGVDYLIQKGIADKNRVGVTGGSYGGYASAWMSTYYSDRFAAAVMFVGISNNISKFGTSDIPTEMALVHERGYIWEDWKKQLEISPIYHVGKANTPILIMHGADDPRVHPAQSMELYRHIKVRKPDVPVRLVYYPGEGHGNARSGSKYDYNLRMMQWFDVYLKSGNRKATMPSLDLPE